MNNGIPDNRFNENKEVIDSVGEVVRIGDTIAHTMFGNTGYDWMATMVVKSFTPTGMPKGQSETIKGAFIKIFRQQ